MPNMKIEIEFVTKQLSQGLMSQEMAVRKLRRLGLNTDQILKILQTIDSPY